MAIVFSQDLPPTRSTGQPDPAGDVNAIVSAVAEIRGVVGDVQFNSGAGGNVGSIEASDGVPPSTPPDDGKYYFWFNAATISI